MPTYLKFETLIKVLKWITFCSWKIFSFSYRKRNNVRKRDCKWTFSDSSFSFSFQSWEIFWRMTGDSNFLKKIREYRRITIYARFFSKKISKNWILAVFLIYFLCNYNWKFKKNFTFRTLIYPYHRCRSFFFQKIGKNSFFTFSLQIIESYFYKLISYLTESFDFNDNYFIVLRQ